MPRRIELEPDVHEAITTLNHRLSNEFGYGLADGAGNVLKNARHLFYKDRNRKNYKDLLRDINAVMRDLEKKLTHDFIDRINSALDSLAASGPAFPVTRKVRRKKKSRSREGRAK